jgi:hypothetical protein
LAAGAAKNPGVILAKFVWALVKNSARTENDILLVFGF